VCEIQWIKMHGGAVEHKYTVWAERGISFYYIRPTNAQYIVYFLDEYNKIYTPHGTFCIKML